MKNGLGIEAVYETETAVRLSKLITAVSSEVAALDKASTEAEELTDNYTKACVYRDRVLRSMNWKC